MISLVVAAYNVEKYIRTCLDSILSQDSNEYEVIVVDDGSTDQTGIICDEYSKKFSQIRVIHQMNMGLSGARNTGIVNSMGEWICFIDGDDAISSKTVSSYSKVINNELDIVYAGYKEVLDQNFKMPELDNDIAMNTIQIDDNSAKKMCIVAYMEEQRLGIRVSSSWAKIYRREFIENNNLLFDSRGVFSQDVIFNLLVFHFHPRLSFVGKKLYFYRVNQAAARAKYSEKLVNTIIPLIEAVIENASLLIEDDDDSQRLGIRVFSLCYKFVHCNSNHIDNKRRYSDRKSDLFNVLNNEKILEKLGIVPYARLNWRRKIILWSMKRHLFFPIEILEKLQYKLTRGRY